MAKRSSDLSKLSASELQHELNRRQKRIRSLVRRHKSLLSKAAETAPKTDAAKTEVAKTETAKPDAAPSSKGMGEGQKPVSQAYKDNWNAIFARKKKKR